MQFIKLLENFSYVDWSLNTQKMSSTYLKYNSGLNLETDNSSFSKCARQKLEKRFIDSKFIPCKKQTQQEGISQFITIPYFGHSSIAFAHKMRQSFKRHYNVNLQCSFNTTKIKNFFSLKCPTPKLLKANVVYKFDCLCDINISYIGKTKRHLATRIKEHRSEKSAIGQHLQTCHTCDHNFNENQFKILSTGNSGFDCKIREALLIKSQKPTLNQQLFQNGSTFILCVFK